MAPEPTWDVVMESEHMFSREIRGENTKLATTRYRSGFDAGLPVYDRGFLHLGMRASYYDNTFRDAPALWGDLRHAGLIARWVHSLDDTWGIQGLASINLASEKGISLRRGDTYGLGGLVQYRISPTLSLGGGVRWSTRLHRSDRIIPMIVVDWRPNEQWVVTTANGLIIRYKPRGDTNHLWEGSALWSSFSFLAKGNPGGPHLGVEEKGWKFTLAYTYTGESGWQVRPYLGIMERREFTRHSPAGQVDRLRTGATPHLGITFGWRF